MTRVPRCRACGGRDRLDQVPLNLVDWIWLHSSCAKTYVHRDKDRVSKKPDPSEGTARAPAFQHPLYKNKRAGALLGFIRGPQTDALGWMRLKGITPASTST